jgi:hypothetical protein
MRPRNLSGLLCLSLVWLAAPLAAQAPDPTPRQALDRAQTLYAQGHAFTAEDFAALADLRQKLLDSGDADLAADLDLLRIGAGARAVAADTRGRNALALAADGDLWADRDRLDRDRGLWRGVRDAGLVSFTCATATTLLLAVVVDKADLALRLGFFTDASQRQGFLSGTKWALVGSAGVMVVSLFPLLWGESRQ